MGIVQAANKLIIDIHLSHGVQPLQHQVHPLPIQHLLGDVELRLVAPGLLSNPLVVPVIVPAASF